MIKCITNWTDLKNSNLLYYYYNLQLGLVKLMALMRRLTIKT